MIHKYASANNAIVFNLDGDDWLPNKDCLGQVAKVYRNNPNTLLTYGDCMIWDGKKIKREKIHVLETLNKKYPAKVEASKSYRSYPFLPLHPRTWKVSLFKSINKREFLSPSGKWLRFAEDQAIFFPMLEEIDSSKYTVINIPIYVYNIENLHSDIRENTLMLLNDEILIRKGRLVIGKLFEMSNCININYSRLLSVPILCRIFYTIESILIKGQLINNIWVSTVKDKSSKELLKNINESSTISIVSIRDPKLHILLPQITKRRTLNLRHAYSVNSTTQELYDLMWSIVLCDNITEESKAKIKPLFPNLFD